LESGPAAGVAAARWWGGLAGLGDLLCFDMGGTTAKLCTVSSGEALVTDDYEAARAYRNKRGSGLAIGVPVFDLLEIGTGGGSIARIDSLGLVKVGPHSAGAVPGPASYARGGTEPTVTDADVALGFLDPEYFLGGSMLLAPQRAEEAIAARIAAPLDLTLLDAALGIHELSNEDMAAAARLHLAERGESASRLSMIAYGGAGPVHAYGLAQKLGIRTVIVPPAAGVMSALGMLVEEPAIDRVRTLRLPLDRVQTEDIDQACGSMTAEAAQLLRAPLEALQVTRLADMRYRGQGYSVRVPVQASQDGSSLVARMRDAFEQAYTAQYGRTHDDVPIELVNLRVIARSRYGNAVRPPPVPAASGDVSRARKGSRRAYFGERLGSVDCPVFDRYRLGSGHRYEGAAFVEERETTIVIWPGGRFEVDEHGMVVVTIGDPGGRQ
jgi:N-methylhydantoinase A